MCLYLPDLWSPTSPAPGTAASTWSGPSLSSSTTGWTGQRIKIKIQQGHHWWCVLCRYNIFIKTRQGEDWEVREVIVPPVTKHNVEKVRDIIVCTEYERMNTDFQSLNPPDKTIYSTNTSMYKIVFMRLFCFLFSPSLPKMSLSKDNAVARDKLLNPNTSKYLCPVIDSELYTSLWFLWTVCVSNFIKCANVLITPLMSQCPVSPLSPADTWESESANESPAQTQGSQSEEGWGSGNVTPDTGWDKKTRVLRSSKICLLSFS